MLDHNIRAIHKFFNGVYCPTDVVVIRVERMPVISIVELMVNAIVIAKAIIKQQLRFVDQFQVVVGDVVDIIFKHDLD